MSFVHDGFVTVGALYGIEVILPCGVNLNKMARWENKPGQGGEVYKEKDQLLTLKGKYIFIH